MKITYEIPYMYSIDSKITLEYKNKIKYGRKVYYEVEFPIKGTYGSFYISDKKNGELEFITVHPYELRKNETRAGEQALTLYSINMFKLDENGQYKVYDDVPYEIIKKVMENIRKYRFIGTYSFIKNSWQIFSILASRHKQRQFVESIFRKFSSDFNNAKSDEAYMKDENYRKVVNLYFNPYLKTLKEANPTKILENIVKYNIEIASIVFGSEKLETREAGFFYYLNCD